MELESCLSAEEVYLLDKRTSTETASFVRLRGYCTVGAEIGTLLRLEKKMQYFNCRITVSLSGLGWKPGWWLRSRSRSHDGDRKPRPKPKPVASILKFRKPKPNPVASKIIIWKPKSKPVASRPEKWKAEATSFGLRSRSRSQTRSWS